MKNKKDYKPTRAMLAKDYHERLRDEMDEVISAVVLNETYSDKLNHIPKKHNERNKNEKK